MTEVRSRSPSPGPARSEFGDDYWDPPCRVCKVVDDEPNVLCELCNGAYHLACIENLKPLPCSPTDDEWFCRGCVKRGVPEQIIDRVGRYSSAHFLVKWLGQPSSEVSWESAKLLDTAWSRCVCPRRPFSLGRSSAARLASPPLVGLALAARSSTPT